MPLHQATSRPPAPNPRTTYRHLSNPSRKSHQLQANIRVVRAYAKKQPSYQDRSDTCQSQAIADALRAALAHLGLWAGLRNIYPEADEQRCWNHRIVNLLDRVAKRHQRTATELLRKVAYAPTQQEAEREKAAFQRWCRRQGYEDAARLIDEDWERLVVFYRYPRAHWTHLRTDAAKQLQAGGECHGGDLEDAAGG